MQQEGLLALGDAFRSDKIKVLLVVLVGCQIPLTTHIHVFRAIKLRDDRATDPREVPGVDLEARRLHWKSLRHKQLLLQNELLLLLHIDKKDFD